MGARVWRGSRSRRAAGASVRRRTGRAARPRRDCRIGARGRALHQPHHLRRRHHDADHARPLGGRARSRPGLDPGFGCGFGRPYRRLPGRVPAQARPCRGSGAAWLDVDRQSGRSSRQHRTHWGDGRSCAGTESEPDRDRSRAVLRLGAEEPCRADADPRAGRARRCRSRGIAAASPGPHRDRRRGARLSRALSETLRRRMGAALSQCDAFGKSAAVPCSGIDTGSGVLERAGPFAGRHLGVVAGVQRVPRHGLSAGALHELRAARDRLRRLPLPGLRAHR